MQWVDFENQVFAREWVDMKLKEFFLISMPIGNLEDITLRTIRVLKTLEVLVVENVLKAKKTLEQLDIDFESKEIHVLNRKNQKRETEDIYYKLLFKSKQAGLISDGGTPVFEVPGEMLLSKLIETNIKFVFLPGASSLVSAV